MTLIAEILISVLLVAGGIFGLIGSYGLIRLPDPMSRLHAPTKAATLGVGSVLIASMLYFWIFEGRFSWHELLVTLFLLLTAPITGHFFAKANIFTGWREKELPAPPEGGSWSGFAPDRRPPAQDDNRAE